MDKAGIFLSNRVKMKVMEPDTVSDRGDAIMTCPTAYPRDLEAILARGGTTTAPISG
jgi:hypothetical protein